MQLKVFAHYGEAQAFIQGKKIESDYVDLYQNKDDYVLITGEGLQNSTESLTVALSFLQGKVSSVCNLGVAGSLSDELKLEKIYKIRTCYAQGAFKSFETSQGGEVDIISADKRVQEQKLAKELSCFADIVDREAFGLASVCHRFKVPFDCLKLIVDFCDNRCAIVTAQAEKFSELLKKFSQRDETYKHDLLLPQDFYFTLAQERWFKSLLKSLLKNYGQETIYEKVELEKISQKKIIAKQKTKLLLENMEHLLAPQVFSTKNKLKNLTQKWNTSKQKIDIDPSLETSTLQLKATLESEEDILKLKKALSSLPYKKIVEILDGNDI